MGSSFTVQQRAAGHTRRSRGFTPQTIVPPQTKLTSWQAAMVAMRNPIELWDRELFSLPFRDIRRGGQRFVEIMDPALMQAVLVDQVDAFKKSAIQQRYIRPALGDGLLAAEGDKWRLQRRAASPCFRASALDMLAPTMARVGEAAVDRLSLARRNIPVDVMTHMMRATFDVVADLLLGADAELLDQKVMEKAVTDYVETIALADLFDVLGGAGWLYRAWPKRGRDGLRAMRGQANKVLRHRQRRGVPRQDLLGRLLDAVDEKTHLPMSDADLRDNILTFITAGNETTALTLTWALYLIANDHEVQERLVAEAFEVLGEGALQAEHIGLLSFHLQVIKETMRLYPPIAILQRRALRRVRIGDIDLRKGDEIVCASYVMHRSTLLWGQPATFDPDRFGPEQSLGRHRLAHMPFGAGKHICLGKPLAYMETVAILATLVRRLRFDPNPAHEIKPIMRLTVRPDGGMPLFVSPRGDSRGSLPSGGTGKCVNVHLS